LPAVSVGGGSYAHVTVILFLGIAVFGMIALQTHQAVSISGCAVFLAGAVGTTIMGVLSMGVRATSRFHFPFQPTSPYSWNVAMSSGIVLTLVLSTIVAIYLVVLHFIES